MPVDNIELTAGTTMDNNELTAGTPVDTNDFAAGIPVEKDEPKAGMTVSNNELKSQKLVDQAELKNAWQLARLKLRNEFTRAVRIIGIILGALLLVNLISGAIWLLTPNDALETYKFMDLSILLPIGMVVGLVVVAAGYASTNKNYEIYPQTNTCRFLSTQALYYAFVVFAAVVLLVIYLIQYATVALIALGQEHTSLPYVFDPVFLIAGFFVLIVGLSLAVALISLIAALVRRFKIYAVTALIVMVAVIFARGVFGLGLISIPLTFLSLESSVMLFLIKGIALWAVLFILTYVINRYTVYYQSNGASKNLIVKVAATGVAAILITGGATYLVAPASLDQLLGGGGSDTNWSMEEQNKEIDISGLPKGSRIQIVTSGDIAVPRLSNEHLKSTTSDNDLITFNFDDGTSQTFPSHYLQINYMLSELNNVDGDKLVITYIPPVYIRNSQVLINPANARLEARLEGTTLYLDYIYDKNVKLAYLPTWTFMGQFDYFIGRNIFQEKSFYSEGESSDHAFVSVR